MKRFKEIIELIAGILAVITAIGGICNSVYASCISTNTEESSNLIWAYLYIIIVSILIIVMVVRYIIQNKKTNLKFEELGKNFYQFLHDYRNINKELECAYKTGQLNEKTLTLTVQKYLEDAMNYLADIFKTMTGQTVCCCIKLILGNNKYTDIKYDDTKVKTFIRSTNTPSIRKSYDNENVQGVKIADNTDFSDIVHGDLNSKNSVFYQCDLREYDKQLRKYNKSYKNSTECWDKYYISAIVAPIRIANNKLFYKKDNSSYDIIGFICVDSLSDNIFKEEKQETYEYIVKSFASVIYGILSDYQYYLLKLTNTDSQNQYANRKRKTK